MARRRSPSPPLPIRAGFTRSGALAALTAGDLSVLQYPASELEPGPHQVWLRWRAPGAHHALGLTGPASGAQVSRSDAGVVLRGEHRGIGWELWWDQPGAGRFGWGLRLVNGGREAVDLDAVWTLDVALTEWQALRRNEYFVAQYLDLTPIRDGSRLLLAVRQNMPGVANPWLALGATREVVGWCTDALQLRSATPGTGLDLSTDLPSVRLQHEHTLAGLQTRGWRLGPGQKGFVGFRAMALADHPAASGDHDAKVVGPVLDDGWAEEAAASGGFASVVPTLFSPAQPIHGAELAEDELLGLLGRSHQVERGPDGAVWSYSAGGVHVVAAAKEAAVLRPHGHIIRVAPGPFPQQVNAAVTVWMSGNFASQLTLGHASAAPLLSVRRSYLGLTQAEGLRIFVRDGGAQWRLLGVPSAWAVAASSATWWYRLGAREIRVRTQLTLAESPALRVELTVEGDRLDVLLFCATGTHDIGGDSAPLFSDGVAVGDQWHTIVHQDVPSASLVIPLAAPVAADAGPVGVPGLAGGDATAQRLAVLLPWLAQNAFVHYQAPRGLEQFTGGAWGTRDVCQGPIGLLVATGRLDVVREVLLSVFAAQQDDGNWPQSFDYLHGYRAAGHRPSHGDVVYWPLLALGDYLQMTGDLALLDAPVGWVGRETLEPPTPMRDHLAAALAHLLSQRSLDARLPAYGHGDWNDSLQPANPELAQRMVSTWMAGLEVKALGALADGLGTSEPQLVASLRSVEAQTAQAIRETLLVAGELCGYAVVTSDGVEPLVHPLDQRTGLRHGSLQMIHAIADELLTPEQALAHLRLIDDHLAGPVGIYLFDAPIEYHGGETRTFLRAEAATFWGREIGLMYTHAHLRWIEALLRLGMADQAWRALDLVIPDGLSAAVPGARPRQSNCYFSSIDAVFTDRVDATARARLLFDPDFGFEGGWRVYSSGPGLVLRLLTEGFLGLRLTPDGVVVDPVLPAGELVASLRLGGQPLRIRFEVAPPGHGVRMVELEGEELPVEPVPRRYRPGGVRVPTAAWQAVRQTGDKVELRVRVGGG